MAMLDARRIEPLGEKEVVLVAAALEHLPEETARRGGLSLDGEVLDLPPVVLGALRDVLRRFAHGEPVVIASADEMLTTSQAADVIGISRTYLCRLLDDERLEFEYRGTHRRVRLGAALSFTQERKVDQRSALDEIANISHGAGLYADDF